MAQIRNDIKSLLIIRIIEIQYVLYFMSWKSEWYWMLTHAICALLTCHDYVLQIIYSKIKEKKKKRELVSNLFKRYYSSFHFNISRKTDSNATCLSRATVLCQRSL